MSRMLAAVGGDVCCQEICLQCLVALLVKALLAWHLVYMLCLADLTGHVHMLWHLKQDVELTASIAWSAATAVNCLRS